MGIGAGGVANNCAAGIVAAARADRQKRRREIGFDLLVSCLFMCLAPIWC